MTGSNLTKRSGLADEMPVYSIPFRDPWPDHSPIIRCGNLAKYTESIQAK